ncbi:MAG TPA: protein kinase [Gemmatimonadales bacterium]|nr:protein kinase [Gemmatimonadales bacterium]
MTTTSGTSGLTWRIFFGAAGVVAIVLLGTLLLAWASVRRTAGTELDRSLARTRELVVTFLQGDRRSLSQSAAVFVQNPNFRALLENPAPGDMLDQSLEAAHLLGATFVQITDASGVRLARSDEPQAALVQLARSPLIAGALEGDMRAGFGVSGDSILFQAVAVPIPGAGPQVVRGSLMAAKAIDSTLASAVKQVTASDVVFFALDSAGHARVAASTLPRDAALTAFIQGYGSRASDSTLARAGTAEMPEANMPRAEVSLGNEAFVGQGGALLSAGGTPLGGFVALRSRALELAGFRDLTIRIVLAGLVGLLLAGVFSYLVAHRISRPVLSLVAATRRAAEGDYATPIEAAGPDEIGQLAEAFGVLLAELREKQSLVNLLREREEQRGLSLAGAERTVAVGGGLTDGRIAPGQVFAGRYEILAALGQGGMGVVYKARDRELDDMVAVKLVRTDLLAIDPMAIERFKDEVRLARRISHRNVARTHDFGEAEGLYYVTMEFVAGTPLRDLIQARHRLPVSATVSVGKQLCRALEAAHEEGIIHRDIKPQNIMVAADGLVKVMDFGIARPVERQKAMTQTGLVIGTPDYMAPEQLLGEPVDPRVDLYAAAVVLYECLTGRRPHEADSALALVGVKLAQDPLPPHEVSEDVPMELSRVIVRALSRNRDDRPATAARLYDELVHAVEEPSSISSS